MAESKYSSFVEELIKMTKEKRLRWEYLDSNKSLCKNMNWVENENSFLAIEAALSGKYGHNFRFDIDRSFYCTVNETNIVIYVADGNPASIFVIPPTFKRIVELLPDEYGEKTTRLLNLVESQFPSADAFIDEFLEKNNNQNNPDI